MNGKAPTQSADTDIDTDTGTHDELNGRLVALARVDEDADQLAKIIIARATGAKIPVGTYRNVEYTSVAAVGNVLNFNEKEKSAFSKIVELYEHRLAKYGLVRLTKATEVTSFARQVGTKPSGSSSRGLRIIRLSTALLLLAGSPCVAGDLVRVELGLSPKTRFSMITKRAGIKVVADEDSYQGEQLQEPVIEAPATKAESNVPEPVKILNDSLTQMYTQRAELRAELEKLNTNILAVERAIAVLAMDWQD